MKRLLLLSSFVILSLFALMAIARGGGHGGHGHGGRGGHGHWHGGRGWGHGGRWGYSGFRFGFGGYRGPRIVVENPFAGSYEYGSGRPDYNWCVRNRTSRCLEYYPELRD